MTDPYDPAREGAQMAFDGRMSYGDYLGLDALLTAQHPISDAPDEMLFIIQHQTSELWMRLMIHELAAARDAIAADRLQPAFKMLARVARIMEQLNNAWDVLRTMTPSDYTAFRDRLGQSSGFQSWQYRMIEYAAGNRNAAMLRPHAHRADILARLQAELARPSLYDGRCGRRRGPGCRFRRMCWCGTSRSLGSSATRSKPPGPSSTARRKSTGRSTNWLKSLWISKITSAAGGSTMSRPSNVSSG
jgi:hypothetical protein